MYRKETIVRDKILAELAKPHNYGSLVTAIRAICDQYAPEQDIAKPEEPITEPSYFEEELAEDEEVRE